MCRVDFWTLRERKRVGSFGRMTLKHVYYHVRNKSPVYVRHRIQDAWGWCMGMIQRDDMEWEGGSGLGAHVHPWLIHVNVWQNQYSIVKQNKVKIKIKKKKRICVQCRRPGFNPWVWKIPWRRKGQPAPVFLPGKSHTQSSLAGYSSWGCKESDTSE